MSTKESSPKESAPRVSPAQFVRQVRLEAIKRVTWPGKQEVISGTVMVFVLAGLVAVFLLLVDQILSWGLRLLIG